MAVRIQLRRDTAANWTSNNPTLREGEIGIETDTLKMKVGNGSSTWTQITSYANVVPGNLNTTLNGYVEVSDIGAESGVAGLNGLQNLLIPNDSIIFEGATEDDYETTLTVTDPTADRTITFPDATGTVALTSNIPSNTDSLSEGSTNIYFTDERAQDAIATAIAAGTHTNITITYDDSTNKFSFVGATTYSDENAQDAVGNAVGTGLSYNDSTGAISVDTATIQARVADVSDTEIGYLNGVTSAIQTQIDSKLSTSTASSTYQPIVSGVSDTEIGYLNGVTSAIQTQLDNKLALSGGTLTGALTLHADPGSALHAATKQYVDNTASGIVAKPQVLGATTANIDATYDNGTLGVGATLTHNTNGAFPTSAGGAEGWAVGKGILVKNQTNKAHNGRYYVSDMGSPSTPYVLTRCGYCDEASEIPGAYIFVQDGTNAGTGWVQTVADATTFIVGTDDITVVQFSGSGTITAGTGITVNGNEVSINTATTADLSTAQTLTNKTINANANTITVTSANVSDFNEAAQDAIGTILGTGLSYNDSGPGIGINNAALSDYLLDGVSGSSYGLIGTSTYLDVKNTNGYNKEIELDIAAVKTQLDTDGYLTTSSTSTLTNKTLSSPTITASSTVSRNAFTDLGSYINGVAFDGAVFILAPNIMFNNATQLSATLGSISSIVVSSGTYAGTYPISSQEVSAPFLNLNLTSPSSTFTPEDINRSLVTINSLSSVTISSTEISYLDGVTSSIQTQLDGKVDESIIAAKGDLYVGSASATLDNLTVGTDGYLLTADANETLGVKWAPAPISLPEQSGENGKYLTTDGSTASWASLVVPITTGTDTVTGNTAETVDTTALSAFTSIEYMVSLKQGSKVRTSKVIVQTDGTSVDMTEFAITETGGAMTGVVVSAAVSSTNAVLQVTVTDASSTNVTVKFSKVAF